MRRTKFANQAIGLIERLGLISQIEYLTKMSI